MSWLVLPSPLSAASSGSSLVTDSSTTLTEPHTSPALIEVETSTRRWLGGQRSAGSAVTTRLGGVTPTPVPIPPAPPFPPPVSAPRGPLLLPPGGGVGMTGVA